jgi:hypothetical protein
LRARTGSAAQDGQSTDNFGDAALIDLTAPAPIKSNGIKAYAQRIGVRKPC